jgi:hypothetical protein
MDRSAFAGLKGGGFPFDWCVSDGREVKLDERVCLARGSDDFSVYQSPFDVHDV